MKKIRRFSAVLFAFLFFIASQKATAQELDWVRTTGSTARQGAMIARDALDNVVSCGYTINDRMFTRKWDQFGNFLWEKQDTSEIFNYRERPTWIATDASNNIITLGYRYYGTSYQQPNAIVVLKYSPTGNLIFKRTIEGVVGIPSRCELDPSGNIYIGIAATLSGEPDYGFNLIKLAPNGNTLFTAIHNFGSYFGVNNMRYRNGYIAITGITSVQGFSFNMTTALFDANGNYLWGVVSNSIYAGIDVEVDNGGNVYVVNKGYASGLDDDMVVTKYSVTGTLLFAYYYDNNSQHEAPSRINLQPDGNLVISGVGTSPSTGLETFKLSSTGLLIWDAFYITPFSDIPQLYFMNTNAVTGDVFLTGTTSISGNPASILTIKYDSAGNESWVAKYDSTATRGMGLAIASDGSVFVVGLNWWTILHYLNITSGGTCGIPANITVSGINNNAATISWNPIANAITYHIQYKASASTIWAEVSTDQTTILISGLSPGAMYDVKVEAVCNNGPSGFSAIQQFTTTGVPYCTSYGLNPVNDRINFVWIGGIQNQTLDIDGYADYTALSTDLIKGSTNSIILSSIIGGSYNQTWRIWIDFNHDGDFLDNGEKKVDFKSSFSGWNNKTLKIPNNVLSGITRMRVSLKKGGPAQTPCEIFAKGEVEDYSVNILPPKLGSDTGNNTSENTAPLQLNIYPNPATNLLTIDLKGFEGKVTIQVFDLSGKLMYVQNAVAMDQSHIDINSLVNGMYILRVMDEKGNNAATKWIKE
ncbi:MAG: GEVED domain-containing protein [Chitinophagales bacterium]